MSFRRALVPVALVAGSLLVIAGAVQAAGSHPSAGASSFSFHDHVTVGTKWHVEIVVDPKNDRSVKTLVVYSEQCKGTIAKTNVPISDDGTVAADGGLKNYGTWSVNFRFIDKDTVVGTMRMIRTDCDTGVLSYPNAITGDGRPSKAAAGHHSGSTRKYADWNTASSKQRQQARGLQQRVLRYWRGITPAKARRRGFFANATLKKKLGVYHVYNQRYEKDGRIFDARRPESLMFWRQPGGSVLLGPMFRVPAGKRPSFAGPIPGYHGHGDAPNQMTHVWMVKGRKSAWANCTPVFLLEQYNPAFKWVPGRSGTQMQFGKAC